MFKNLVGECFIIWFEQIKFNLIDFKDLEIKEPKLKIKQMFSLFYLLLKLFYLSPFNAFGAQLRIHFNFPSTKHRKEKTNMKLVVQL